MPHVRPDQTCTVIGTNGCYTQSHFASLRQVAFTPKMIDLDQGDFFLALARMTPGQPLPRVPGKCIFICPNRPNPPRFPTRTNE